MQSTPFFKAFGPLLFGRRAKSSLEKLSRLKSLKDLYATFGDLFPERLLDCSESGLNSRQRCLTPAVTFWSFVYQALSPKSSCRCVVRKIQAWWRWQNRSSALTPSAYCQARQRLNLDTLRLIRAQIAWHLERNVLSTERWLGGRTVKIVDGTGVSMPDTPELQKLWPQTSAQAPGCGFPQLKLVGLFSLSSGALLEEAIGNKHDHETSLFRTLWPRLEKGDVILEDRGFCSYSTMATLLHHGVDTVARLHQSRSNDQRQGKAFGVGDRLLLWHKPKQCPAGYTQEEFELLPDTLAVRLIRVVVQAAGFRTRSLDIVTTLTDAKAYPAKSLRELYAQRWMVELHFAQIKNSLGLDVLRCKSPEMIEKELQIQLIAYNLVLSLMQKAAHRHGKLLTRMSFKGALDTLRQWSKPIHACSKQPQKQQQLIDEMLALIAADEVPERPGRSEPRAVKRRPKNYHHLNKPRQDMEPLPHRNRTKKHPKNPLS